MVRYTYGLNSMNPLIFGRASICVVFGMMTPTEYAWISFAIGKTER